MAKHRAAASGAKTPHVWAAGVVSAGLLGGLAGPAMAADVDTVKVSEVSITIPELSQGTAGKNNSKDAQKQLEKNAKAASRDASKKALPAAQKVNKAAKPKAEKVQDTDAFKSVHSHVKPLLKEAKPALKPVQPLVDAALQDETVSTVASIFIPAEDLAVLSPKSTKVVDTHQVRGEKILQAARTRIGDPYVWGASGPHSFDCSGLVLWAHEQLGIHIPRTSQDQVHGGHAVARKDLRPGDIVAFYGNASHVGVYAGHNRVVHAPYSGTSVEEVSMDSMPYYGATRYY